MNNSKFNASKKRIILIISVIVVAIAIAACGTLAWLTYRANPEVNSFETGDIACQVVETFTNDVKTDVKVQNIGNADAYVRAALVINWVDEDGNVYGSAPVENSDYTIQLDTENWFKASDGYYYCKAKVAPGNESAVLINRCQKSDGAIAPEGYHLQVKVIASAIQADPAEAVQDAWKSVAVNNGQLIAVPSV